MLTRRQWLAAAALFALTLLVRLPVRWVAPLLPASAHCVDPSGTLWSGHCARAGAGTLMLSDVSWSLQPWLLLTATLSARVRSGDPNAPLEAVLRYGRGGRFAVRDLKGNVAIGAGLLPFFPDGWSGTLSLDIRAADFRNGVPQRIRGVLDASGLRQRPPADELGSYQLRFDDAATDAAGIRGTLRDTGGPLAVAAALQIANNGAYELSGAVMARAAASPSLAAAVASLGPADATGRRQFSLAGSF
jgi:hypothetical protein